MVRHDVAGAVRAAIETRGSLYAWAAAQHPKDVFQGRGETFGVTLGPCRAVVRHARRGGAMAPLLGDRYFGTPRFLREIAASERLGRAGVATPAVLAGIVHRAGLGHRADVATQRVDGRDLAAIFFGDQPPAGEPRALVLRAAGSCVRHLHDAGFVHPDLQLRNVLIAPEPGAAPSVYRPAAWLLDVDTVEAIAPTDAAARHGNLARFDRSWAKWNAQHGVRLTPDDRVEFRQGYESKG